MPRKDAPEFTWDEKKQLYKKKVKDPATGKWVTVYGRTKAELREKKRQREEQLALRHDEASNPYVWQYAKTWYELNTKNLSYSRKEDYSGAINIRICPIIGNMRVRDVKPDDIKRVMAAAEGMSKSIQQKLVTTLKRIFESAEDNDLIARTPCRGIKAGGEKSKEKEPLSDAQAAKLIDAVKDTRAYLFVMLGLYTGMRREEICGLKWDSVYLEAEQPYIHVRRTVTWPGNSKPVLSDKLKSAAANRMLPIPEPLLSALLAARKTAKSDYVLCGKDGSALSYTAYRNIWRFAGDAVPGLHITSHHLRHTYITNLILAGGDLRTAQYLAGHATAQMTLNVYTHLIANQPKDTAKTVNKAYGAKNEAAAG